MTFVPRAQEIYKHFKGNLYQIVTVAEHTETGEALVIYQAMYGEFKIYARPLSMFCSRVDKERYPDATQEYRFELQQIGNTFSVAGNTFVKEADVTAEDKHSLVYEPEMETVVTEASQLSLEETDEPSAEAALDPELIAFLDAETYVDKLNVLSAIHHRITDDMITTMSIACDIEIEEGDLENRYNQLKNCLLTLDKYEITRLR